MADRAEKEAELWERAEQAARDPYIEDKQEVLRHIEGLPVQFSTTEVLCNHLQQKRGLGNSEIAGILLEMQYEGLIKFQATGGGVLVYISEQGLERVE